MGVKKQVIPKWLLWDSFFWTGQGYYTHELSIIWPPAYDLQNPHQSTCQQSSTLDKESMAAEGRRTGFLQGLTPNPKWSPLNMYLQATLTGFSKVYITAIITEGELMSSRGGSGGDMRRIGVGRDINDANSAFMHETLKNHKSKPGTKELCLLRAECMTFEFNHICCCLSSLSLNNSPSKTTYSFTYKKEIL